MAKTKQSKRKPRKVNLVFDEEKRRDFLTGFHKRKLQRKKKAQEKLEVQLKEERKRLKSEAKESYKKLVATNRPIPELEHLLEEQYEDEDVTVKITELSTNEMAKENNWIGANVPKYQNEEDEDLTESDKETNEIPGMELKRTKKVVKKEEKQEFNSKKDIKRALKKKATKNVQKSAIFQKKNKIERQKQKKKSFQQKREQMKTRKKLDKRKGNRKVKE